MLNPDPIPQAWLDHLDRIKTEMILLHEHRAIWREMRDALVEASPDDDVSPGHYAQLYGDRQVIAIRRLIDRDDRTSSLLQLVKRLADHPNLLTRERWLSFFSVGDDAEDEHWLRMAHQQFDASADPADPNRVDPAVMASFANEMKTELSAVKTYVDKVVAHMDSCKYPPSVTWKQLDEAIDLLGAIFRRVYLLLTASSMMQLEPVIQSDWKRPFRAPLFPPIRPPAPSAS